MSTLEIIDNLRHSVKNSIVKITQQSITRLQYPDKDTLTLASAVMWLIRMLGYGIGIWLSAGVSAIGLILTAAAVDSYLVFHTGKSVKELKELHQYEQTFERLVLGI